MLYSSYDRDARVWVHHKSAETEPKLRVRRLPKGRPGMIQDVQVVMPGDAEVHSSGAVARGLVIEPGQAPCRPCDDGGGFSLWQIGYMAWRAFDFVAGWLGGGEH